MKRFYQHTEKYINGASPPFSSTPRLFQKLHKKLASKLFDVSLDPPIFSQKPIPSSCSNDNILTQLCFRIGLFKDKCIQTRSKGVEKDNLHLSKGVEKDNLHPDKKTLHHKIEILWPENRIYSDLLYPSLRIIS
jgi:hypothetical protein